jgi:hypothetical protein
MIVRGRVAVGILALLLSTAAVRGQTGAHYRDFQLGGTLASVAALTGQPVSNARTAHDRPATLQDLEWKRPYSSSGDTSTAPDSVQQIAFSFYNDQLFRLVIDYDRERTDGMTDADMMQAISAMFGSTVAPSLKTSGRTAPQIEQESGTRVAGWGKRGSR